MANISQMHPLAELVFTVYLSKRKHGKYLLKAHLHTFFPLPSACLSSHPSISLTALTLFPHRRRELICQNIHGAHCDHLVNTPIILSASASPSHPAVEMTPRGWQFNLPITDGGYHGGTVRQPFPVDFYFYPPRERCCWSASRHSPS